MLCCFFFQAEDGIRDLVRSRGLGDVYKRQTLAGALEGLASVTKASGVGVVVPKKRQFEPDAEVLSLIHI